MTGERRKRRFSPILKDAADAALKRGDKPADILAASSPRVRDEFRAYLVSIGHAELRTGQ